MSEFVEVVFLSDYLGRQSLQISLTASDRLEDLKLRLQLPSESRVIFNGLELHEGPALRSLGVGAGSCVYCLVPDCISGETAPEAKLLKVIDLSGRSLSLEASSESISSLKGSLSQKLRLPIEGLRLLHDGRELRDDEILGLDALPMQPTLYLLHDEPSSVFVERRIDALWFRAQILKVHEDGKLDLLYLDDGNLELAVEASECRPV